jgi:hypothetical protein
MNRLQETSFCMIFISLVRTYKVIADITRSIIQAYMAGEVVLQVLFNGGHRTKLGNREWQSSRAVATEVTYIRSASLGRS